MPSQKPLVPAGETGEICIFGGGVSLGYIGGYEEKNKAFQTLPDGTVRYQSGDLGYTLPNGNIAFLHRKDTQIMIYGKRVEISEVESRLYQCKGVSRLRAGKKIVNWLIQQARQNEIAKIYLETSECGRTLYQELGFDDMTGYMKL